MTTPLFVCQVPFIVPQQLRFRMSISIQTFRHLHAFMLSYFLRLNCEYLNLGSFAKIRGVFARERVPNIVASVLSGLYFNLNSFSTLDLHWQHV